MSLCIPPFCYGSSTGSVSAGKSKIGSDFQSVAEQSGIKAGDGGFQVDVAGNTALKGSVIASTDHAVDTGANSFNTGGALSISDIQNRADYKGSAYSVTVGSSAGTSSAGIGKDKADASSTSTSGISGIAGNTAVRSTDAETGLKPIFDVGRVQNEINAQVAITQYFGQHASKAVGDYAEARLKDAIALRTRAQNEPDENRARQLRTEAEALEDNWGATGKLRVLAHATIGGLTGGVGGAVGAAAGTLTAPTVAQALQSAGIDGPLASTLTALASTAVGVVAGGSAGAGAAFNEVANNFLTHAESSKRLQLRSELLGCKDDACRSDKQAEIGRLNQLDVWRDEQIAQACISPASAACQSWTAAIQTAAHSYTGQYGNMVDIAERSSVLNQAFKYQQAVNNPFMHGVGKGLLKLTPPGLVVGLVGGIASTVQSIAENGLTQTVIDSANAISGLPADLKQRLNSSDPTVRGEALVDLVTLGTGATALVAGGTKLTLNTVQKAQVAQAVAKAEAQAVVKMRVENALYTDWPVASDLVKYRVDQLADIATSNPGSNTVVLGRYIPDSAQSYEQVAKAQGATYFELPGKSWENAVQQLGAERMWSINQKFLADQVSQGKSFVFTADPRKVPTDSFTAKEFNYLTNNGYQLIESSGGYRAVKK